MLEMAEVWFHGTVAEGFGSVMSCCLAELWLRFGAIRCCSSCTYNVVHCKFSSYFSTTLQFLHLFTI